MANPDNPNYFVSVFEYRQQQAENSLIAKMRLLALNAQLQQPPTEDPAPQNSQESETSDRNFWKLQKKRLDALAAESQAEASRQERKIQRQKREAVKRKKKK